MASYTKLRTGDWGIKGNVPAPAPGDTVLVTKANGDTKTATVARVIWTGNGVWIAAIEREPAPVQPRAVVPQRYPAQGHGYWCSCDRCGDDHHYEYGCP
jgi:hypothetical protein